MHCSTLRGSLHMHGCCVSPAFTHVFSGWVSCKSRLVCENAGLCMLSYDALCRGQLLHISMPAPHPQLHTPATYLQLPNTSAQAIQQTLTRPSQCCFNCSSTLATVGAIAGVGVWEGRSGFNGLLFVKMVSGWVLTIIAATSLTCECFVCCIVRCSMRPSCKLAFVTMHDVRAK
jgi:hypothetical protein